MRALGTVVGVVLLGLGAAGAGSQAAGGASPAPLRATLAKLPLHIIENRGLYPDPVAYYLQGSDKTLFFTREGITFQLKGRGHDCVVKLEFVGGSPDVVPRGKDRQQAVFSYFRGPREAWRTGLASFGEVVYEDLWPGIDLVYRAGVGAVKYEFRLTPWADPGKIRLRYRGAASVGLTGSGALRVETPVAVVEDAPPVAWQHEDDGVCTPVDVAYSLTSPATQDEGATVRFEVGTYRADRELVIDPAVFVYCGYLGGSESDQPSGVAVDPQGNAYVAGLTHGPSPTFPVHVGPSTTYPGGGYSGFVAKVDASGRCLLYCGYIGGSSGAWATGIAVDAAGCAYVVGEVWSTESSFPVTVGPDLTFNGKTDCFVAKVNAAGTGLDYCGYLGGYGNDCGTAIAVDAKGCAYVVGYTASEDATHAPPGTPFPTAVGPDVTFNGGINDAFVAKLDPTGTTWLYCGYIGGMATDIATAVAVDAKGCAYVVGYTASDETTFPVAVGPGRTMQVASDGFVAKVNAAGTGLDYCGYLGGSGTDELNAVAVDAGGCACVAGNTQSPASTLPLAVGPGLQRAGTTQDCDVLVAKVSPTGAHLVYCGLISGDLDDVGYGIAADAHGHAYVAGGTASSAQTFPAKKGPQLLKPGWADAFVAKIDTTGLFLHYCGYIGGAVSEGATGIAITPAGNAFVTGMTCSSESSFPVTMGPGLTYNLGNWDGFVAKVKFTDLMLSGTPQIGGTVILTLTASDSPGLCYQIGSSFGTGPMRVDTRQIDLSPDPLLVGSVNEFWPSVFSGYRGLIDATGRATAAIHIPKIPAFVGMRIHTSFVTIHSAAPSGIRSISGTETFTVTS
ncbi:MAG: SBBP repeat-containing protein [Planctomycetes bacterium]|nr:SBBP repeat-containing protein [Planctomycetota bacterium]